MCECTSVSVLHAIPTWVLHTQLAASSQRNRQSTINNRQSTIDAAVESERALLSLGIHALSTCDLAVASVTSVNSITSTGITNRPSQFDQSLVGLVDGSHRSLGLSAAISVGRTMQ
jgi:hypothetical protein